MQRLADQRKDRGELQSGRGRASDPDSLQLGPCGAPMAAQLNEPSHRGQL